MSTIPVLQKLKHLLLQYVKICLARQVGTHGPSDGHSGTKRWASTEQGTGTHCPCDVHRVPNVWRFLGIDKSSLIALRLLNQHDTEPRYKKGLLPKQKTLYFFATCRNEVLQEKTKLLVDELFSVLDNEALSVACHFLTHEVECSTLVCCLRSIDV